MLSMFPREIIIFVMIINGKMQGRTLNVHAEIPLSAAVIKTLVLSAIAATKMSNKIEIKKSNFFKNASNYLTKVG